MNLDLQSCGWLFFFSLLFYFFKFHLHTFLPFNLIKWVGLTSWVIDFSCDMITTTCLSHGKDITVRNINLPRIDYAHELICRYWHIIVFK